MNKNDSETPQMDDEKAAGLPTPEQLKRAVEVMMGGGRNIAKPRSLLQNLISKEEEYTKIIAVIRKQIEMVKTHPIIEEFANLNVE